MEFSHRDHRVRRELRRLYVALGASVGALSLVAYFFPYESVRLLAVVGLVVAGILYVMGVDRSSALYQRDLAAVRGGQPISGSVRAEVYHEVGFDRNRDDDREPSPSHRQPRAAFEPTALGPSSGSPTSTRPARSDPPSDGS